MRITGSDNIIEGFRLEGDGGIEITGGYHNLFTIARIVLDTDTKPAIMINPGPGKWTNLNRFSDIYIKGGAYAFEINGDPDKCGFSASGLILNAVGAPFGPNLTRAISSNPDKYSINELAQ